ncbi:adenylyl-sulfate kinase [Thermosipho sp. 1070]|uniref:adenylyl-sulfate kinase n=1 Tax=Thermosipho sp. 1070 TaxID=1437364 RepID=UPI00094933DB|nr:adenylyl-sulfate kinase [Thermosipho sp. 1070]ANQ53289.1 adenylylsulfate kinase [Thermosipho sp. 1070]
MSNFIIWLTGKSGTGKSTLAKKLNEYYQNSIILEGYEIFKNINLDIKARMLILGNISYLLSKKFIVIVPSVSPLKKIRKQISKNSPVKFFEIYISSKLKEKNTPFSKYVDSIYEISDDFDLEINTSLHNIDECVRIIIEYVNKNIQGV